MGEVYLAEDLRLGRKVAIKLLLQDFLTDDIRLSRFDQEARVISALNHPNILTIFEVGQDGSRHFIATEYVEGETLHERMKRGGLTLRDALDIAIQVASALSGAHAAGVVHRDIKPENVMLRPDGYVKVLDFGLAKLTEAPRSEIDPEGPTRAKVNTEPGMVMGTVFYMSPEQTRGRDVDARTDIFSFGVMLYEMITGHRPFDGESTSDVIAAILKTEPLPLSHYCDDIPEELEWIITKALRKDREERYQSIKELHTDLKNIKQQIDFEAEKERSAARSAQGITTGRLANSKAGKLTDEQPPARTSNNTMARQTVSSIPNMVSGIKRRRGVWAITIALIAITALAAAISLWPEERGITEFPIEQHTLKNGLRVVLSEDPTVSSFSIVMTYNVGSRDEQPGKTSLAHLFEHMMFQGSENVGKGEHTQLVLNNGGQTAGKVSQDHTEFFLTLPANQLDLGLFLEADRLRSLNINQANLDNQRQVVKSEMLSNFDNVLEVGGRALLDLSYDNFAYKHHPFGSIEDLNNLTVDDLKQFFRTHYTPNNAVLTISGNFKSDEALAKVKKYFEDIPSSAPPAKSVINEPEQQSERRQTLNHSAVTAPMIFIGFKVPAFNTPEWYASMVMVNIIGNGTSSRLYQKLVKEKEVAARVSTRITDHGGSPIISINATARPGKDIAQIEKIISEEIEKARNDLVTDGELEKMRLMVRRERSDRLQTTYARASMIGEFAARYGDAALINSIWDKLNYITKEDLLAAAQKYFAENRRSVVILQPGAATPRANQPASEQQASNSKPERKGRAPVSNEVLTVKIPKAVEAVLDNGLTVLIIEDHRLPAVTAQIQVGGAGALYDPPEWQGLADVTARMLTEGTQKYSSKQLAENLEHNGASIAAAAGYGQDIAIVRARGLSDNIDTWLPLVAETIINPTFPSDELNTLKQRMMLERQSIYTSAEKLSSIYFTRAVYGTHPAGNVIASAKTLESVTQEQLIRWHKERYAPQNTILGIAGDVNAEELIPKLNKLFSQWQRNSTTEVLPENPLTATTRRIQLIELPNASQTSIYVGNIIVDRRDPDFLPVMVLNNIMGEKTSSRFSAKLREEKGYASWVRSFFTQTKYPGHWAVTGNVHPESTEAALNDIFEEMRRINEERVPDQELEESKRALAAGYAISLEQSERLLNLAIVRKKYGFSVDYWDTFPGKVMGVSADDVQRVARKYLNPSALQVVIVGRTEKLQAPLTKLGPVETLSIKD